MISGEGTAFVPGVSAQEVFDLVLDPNQYLKANHRVVAISCVAPTENGMVAREDGLFMGRFKGSVISRYTWEPPHRIDTTLVHGNPKDMHAWWEIWEADGGCWMKHTETLTMPPPAGKLFDLVAARWLRNSVQDEIDKLAELLKSGARGQGLVAALV